MKASSYLGTQKLNSSHPEYFPARLQNASAKSSGSSAVPDSLKRKKKKKSFPLQFHKEA